MKTATQGQGGKRSPGPPDFFKNVLDQMQIGVIIADAEGYIIYINDTYARFVGINAEQQIGKHATAVVSNTRLHIVAQTGVPEINYPHEFKEVGYLVHRVPLKENGRVTAVVGLVLFEDAPTVSRLTAKLSVLESKVKLYEDELASLRATHYTFDNIVSKSPEMAALKIEAIQAAAKNFPVLITGESGTGKELFAQAIHHGSARRPFPFVRVNCAAIPKDLFESEFFGYEKGAFTGANARGKPGKFELAHMGTIFLDEVGDLPIEMQPKLLRVLESKEFEHVGGNRVLRSDFRLIAATNQDIQQAMAENRFRQDLYYRMNVIHLEVPPLRERPVDIPALAEHFLMQCRAFAGVDNIGFSPEALACLAQYRWPGNARELLNVIERTIVSLERPRIHKEDLPAFLAEHPIPEPREPAQNLKSQMAEAEKRIIKTALAASGNNKSKAARHLGIHRTLLHRKLKLLGIG